MNQTPHILDELENDALTELVNIGVSRAAVSLRKMVGNQVTLSVPSVEVVGRKLAATLIQERESDELVAVRQDFTGAFNGRALLIFPESNSLELVRAVTQDELSRTEMVDIEEEALAETGNVVLNGCLATMANILQRPLTMSLPQVLRGDGQILFELAEKHDDDGVVLFLYINFAISGRDIRGYIAMLMDLPSLQSLKELIGEFIARVVGTDGGDAH
ncbi:chemotaxis protein CheX [Nitrospirillum amazonense]|uniref:CheC inhibitor of MCP methylation n=1 Tax=Nitrospirillum amazonense TaxID=28077 RepID=A0A560GCP4_9PROT|nr:chemotaxis protein CheX [Nitrospirillum amazonense]MDG3443833.1 chemotaxis protein CheX [Nitrospirillum amazonense]MEC4595201.1 chemotaxis protein CheX [Nitrospirillum amazonense]TWB31682.1 CheC inhibitor of MCP methylation [Nitrospirillum amazonense]